MKLFTNLVFLGATFILLSFFSPMNQTVNATENNLGPVTSKDTIYQIITDRFYDGDPTNNIPFGTDPTLLDDPDGDGLGNGEDLKLYQGGDWQGIIEKIPYLKNMGITALWISTPYENRDTIIKDYQSNGTIDFWTSYHGYHARNYFAPNLHFGYMEDFEQLVNELHANDIKLVIDFVTNHTSRWQNPTQNFAPEDGKLYEPDKDQYGNYVFDTNGNPIDYNGDGKVENLLADPNNDYKGFFHGIGDRGSDSSRFGFRHKDLGSLADFSHENALVVEHLEQAINFWTAKGVDGIRHDATLHMSPAFAKGLKDSVDSSENGPLTHFGEFFIGRPDPKYEEYASFPTRTGINNLDFEYFRALTNTFGNFSESMTDFGNMVMKTNEDYIYENQTVTFIDNHDVTRFGYIQQNEKPYHAALATLMTSRGIPNIYYGTEQYLNPGKSGENDGRMFMQTATNFDENTTAYNLIKSLSNLRKTNDAIAYGETNILYSSENVLVYNRKFYDKEVIVAVNRQPDLSYSVPALATSLPVGTYDDHLNGLLDGSSVTVRNINGINILDSFTLSPGEVNVWSYNPSHSHRDPRIGDVVSTMGREGNTVYIYGAGLDGNISVKFGTVEAQVVSNTSDFIETTVPAVTPGIRNITVSKSGETSNAFRYDVLSGDQVQVNFKVSASTYPGESIYVIGSIPELGNWDPNESSEAMLNPSYPEWFLPISVPENTTFEFKFIKKDTSGNVIWESGPNRVFTSPSNSTRTLDTPLYFWRN